MQVCTYAEKRTERETIQVSCFKDSKDTTYTITNSTKRTVQKVTLVGNLEDKFVLVESIGFKDSKFSFI